MEIFLEVVIIVFGVLQIILFFKIWGMTNNVKKMTSNTEQILDVCIKIKSNTIDDIDNTSIDSGFNIGDLVVDKDDNQWRVVEINAPIIKCKNSTKGVVEFDMKELRLF